MWPSLFNINVDNVTRSGNDKATFGITIDSHTLSNNIVHADDHLFEKMKLTSNVLFPLLLNS